MSKDRTTVVLASHDLARWDHLRAAIESVRAQRWPLSMVVAVDHNEPLMRRVREEFPDVVVTPNKYAPGASGTRNSGAHVAQTPLIAFLDDDARAEPDWLEKLLAPLSDQSVVGTGGGVRADWSTGRPEWFPEEFNWVVGASFLGQPISTTRVRNVWSENMAVRRDVFESVGGFRQDFGKVGDRSRPEDTDLCIRMSQASQGGAWMYVPDALAHHYVPPARSTYRFFLRRTYLEGRGKVEMSQLLGPQERLQSERDYITKVLPGGVRAGLLASSGSRRVGFLHAAAITTGLLSAGAGASVATVERIRSTRAIGAVTEKRRPRERSEVR